MRSRTRALRHLGISLRGWQRWVSTWLSWKKEMPEISRRALYWAGWLGWLMSFQSSCLGEKEIVFSCDFDLLVFLFFSFSVDNYFFCFFISFLPREIFMNIYKKKKKNQGNSFQIYILIQNITAQCKMSSHFPFPLTQTVSLPLRFSPSSMWNLLVL